MKVLRQARVDDLDDLYQLSLSASLGVTNLPQNLDLLKGKLLKAEESFQKEVQRASDEIYIFSLEDFESGKVVGTSSIIAASPSGYPMPYFKRISEKSEELAIPHLKEIDTLQIHPPKSRQSELCGLFLDANFRQHGAGKLLSLGRLAYLADHLKRFKQNLFADLRGVINKEGECLFWNAILRYFCPVTFEEAIQLYIFEPEQFAKMLPKHSIYVALLPKEAQELIGAVHKHTRPALDMLSEEGFSLTNEIHPLDGGPKLMANLRQIHSIQNSSVARVDSFEDLPDDDRLLSTTQGPFYACLGSIKSNGEGKVLLPHFAKEALHIKEGDLIRYL